MNFNEYLELFEGNKEAAIRNLTHEVVTNNYNITKNKDVNRAIAESLQGEDRETYKRCFKEEYKANPTYVNSVIKNTFKFHSLGLTFDEIKKAKKNPFKAKIMKSILIALCGCVAFFATSLYSYSTGDMAIYNVAKGLSMAAAPYISITAGFNIINYFKFKSAKRILDKSDNIEANTNYEEVIR